MAPGPALQQARLLARRLRTDASHVGGEWRRRLAGAARGPEAVLLVLGCQRSGTTLMTQILARDPAAKVYPEHSSLSAADRRHRLRLGGLETVAQRISASRFPLVVLKPLVESQNAAALLAAIPKARALWMFRDPADVVRSNLARFGLGNGIRNLRSVAEDRSGDWRSEGASPHVLSVVREHFSDTMDPWDAAALFWWARNSLFFELGLQRRDDVRTCRYEELVAEPERTVRGVYAQAKRPFPGAAVLEGVSAASVGLGRQVELSPGVSDLCESLLARLEQAHAGGCACA